ncbi:site-specific integrase [Pontibacter arcticus]|uniref:Site-specific integrase n=1 Tax=Pontibacter arcticus TaxID=2080288 RepID=A0A364RCA4_9BACT|nr:site-specific integrase [Pontibacter arcticus]RAU81978.1 site-specific integrase [Pontibacter arcticus]
MTKVTLRQKPISKGRQTLYLDYYPPIPNPETGKLTRREFLSLFVYDKPKTPLDKQHNKDTQVLAANIRATRQLEVQNKQYGFLPTSQRDTTLNAYYTELAAKREGSNSANWKSSLYFLNQFFDEGIKLSQLTAPICNDYKAFLLTAPNQRGKDKEKKNATPISRNTAVSYFNKFKATLKQAYKDGLLQTDLNKNIQAIKPQETQREYLTLEELQTLYSTPCSLPIIKQAAIFSALTGLRFSDIQKLTWSELQQSQAEGYYIQFRQQKTKGVEVLPVPEQAILLLGERGKPEAKAFPDLQYSAYNNSFLKDWIKAAGITKPITFHCFRHTYATLQLSLGTDIYTVSKMLGHRELKTTQVYAKVIDKAKREAAGKIKLSL